ncbi:SulP family inorganic anion transporter [Alcanivorax sp. JB21]|uniref:SulP family inorganic anion transporter n=1 Tax=Alcanivorax limicola TaxID=2874102 RepID=UPI001CBBA264|nr:SulP family inorganic anion transporter [Alcanivorax limicola]MBZ2190255.1 SulP family inorganic anion transporter [Alcanivorax limicola]
MLQYLKNTWFFNVRGDVLAGLVVALALIPEAIAFSVLAGVDPKVGLYASFSIAVITSIVGGRPGMISAATGAMALLMVNLVDQHGLQYLLAATVLTGVFQVILGQLGIHRVMRFVSRSVMTGFVNALAILIFMAQLKELGSISWEPATIAGFSLSVPVITYMHWAVYAMVIAGLGIIYLLPLVTRIVPSPLVCILIMTGIAMYFGLDIRDVGATGDLPDSLPHFLLPDVPINFDTLMIILPTVLSLTVVGLLESLMTANIVDDLTDTESDAARESKGQGVANIVTGFFGGMAGCAMIGQSVINVQSGGRGRLSCLVAGVVLLMMVVFLGEWVSQIPMAALVAVMVMVSIGTFSWRSLTNLREHPMSSNIVMISTVVVVVLTHNLAIGVLVGVLLSTLFFANKVGRLMYISSTLDETGRVREYQVVGQVFFSSAEEFVGAFDFREAVEQVVIDLHRAHFWDITAISALDKVIIKLRREGAEVEIRGLNEASATLVDKFGVHDKPDALERMSAH